MRKLLRLFGSLSFFVFAQPAFAQVIETCPSGNFSALCNLNADSIPDVVRNIITILLIIAVIIAVFFLIYGGIRWIVSGGDKQAVETARNHIIAAIIGLIIALLAFFIISFIGRIFGIDLFNLNIPNLTRR